MKKQFRKTSAMLCAMAVMAAPMTFSSFVANADGETVTSDYTLTIPATLAVANSGWNSIGNLTATGTLAQGKKLNVTATSENSWKLTSGENTVAYKLCGETEKEKTYADATDTTSLDISKELLEQTSGFSIPIGIVVEDYSTKPAGDYSDTVTFTAKVDAVGPLAAAFKDGAKIKFVYNFNENNSNTYFEFTNNNGSYTLSSLQDAEFFNTTNLRVKADNPNVLILDVVCGEKHEWDDEFERMEPFCSTIEFNTTDNTFKFTNRGATPTNPPRECKLISVSVNDTDITNQLSEKTN